MPNSGPALDRYRALLTSEPLSLATMLIGVARPLTLLGARGYTGAASG